MGLHPQASSINCGRVNDGICATFELTFLEGCWSMAMGGESKPSGTPNT